MCRCMVVTQSATAEIRRGKTKKEWKKQDKDIMSASATQGGRKQWIIGGVVLQGRSADRTQRGSLYIPWTSQSSRSVALCAVVVINIARSLCRSINLRACFLISIESMHNANILHSPHISTPAAIDLLLLQKRSQLASKWHGSCAIFSSERENCWVIWCVLCVSFSALRLLVEWQERFVSIGRSLCRYRLI